MAGVFLVDEGMPIGQAIDEIISTFAECLTLRG